MSGEQTAGAVERFRANRDRLFGLAYRLLGSAAEAEDVLQEAYLRWAGRGEVAVPEAWLTTVVTNLCLNQLTSARVQRERYVGCWLPEPVLTAGGALGPLETVEQRESVSLGFLLLLERLSPPERAVFVLREAFGHPYREIAEIIGVTEPNARQLARRARLHLNHPRRLTPVDRAEHARVVAGFVAAALDGDLPALQRLLAEPAESRADGGDGEVAAARRPIRGRDRVARYWHGLAARPEAAQVLMRLAEVNGEPAALLEHEGALRAVVAVEVTAGLITAVRLVAGPHKLAFLAAQR